MARPHKRTARPPRVVPTLTTEEEAFLSAISAPENKHLFSLEAVSKAYAHTKRLRPDMTEPHQRTRALLKTRVFLEQLTCPEDTPRVPADVRAVAKRLLRDFLTHGEIELIHEALPEILGPVVQRQDLGMPTPKEPS